MVEWQWILVAVLCTAAWLVMGFGVRAILIELRHWAGEVWLTPLLWPMLLLIAGLDAGKWVRDRKLSRLRSMPDSPAATTRGP